MGKDYSPFLRAHGVFDYWTQPYPCTPAQAELAREELRASVPKTATCTCGQQPRGPHGITVHDEACGLSKPHTDHPMYTFAIDPALAPSATAFTLFESEIAEADREISRLVMGMHGAERVTEMVHAGQRHGKTAAMKRALEQLRTGPQRERVASPHEDGTCSCTRIHDEVIADKDCPRHGTSEIAELIRREEEWSAKPPRVVRRT